jgi:hypothetical protein
MSWGIFALAEISQWPDGVAALADSDVFEELQQLELAQESENDVTKVPIHKLLQNIAWYEAGRSDSVQEESFEGEIL